MSGLCFRSVYELGLSCCPRGNRRHCRGDVLSGGATAGGAAAGRARQPRRAQQPASPQEPKEPTYEETVVVSASKTEQKLVDAPATMTVIGAEHIERATSQNFAELLRTVPGLNITQVSARDINVTSRAPTGTLATGQLALLDGRSLYQDFFGFVMWDFLPINLNEIRQIEVIRGPASAVWGANAVYGVINVITKSPREMQGTSATVGLGTFERTGDTHTGSLLYASGTHAQAINDRWAYKFSVGTYQQDAMSRPTGVIPGSPPPGTQYPPFRNTGTTQPKFDGRLDYDFADGRKLSFTGGVAGTQGIMHSGIGPFDIDNGSTMGYGRASFQRKALRVAAFAQRLDGDATNLIARDPTGAFIPFAFKTNTFDAELSNVATFATRHVVTYGGNLRHNTFDLSIAPQGENRTEFGVYGQDEIFLSDKFRWTLGARVDRFDYLNDLVFSPRTALLIKPRPDHTFRVSYNRAYRSPSVINNFLDVTLTEPLPLGLINPALAPRVYLIPIRPVGNQDLTETSLDAYEAGYTGVVGGRTVLSAAFYVNKSKNDIFFTENRRPALDGGEPAARLAAPAGGHPAVIRPPGFSGLLHVQEFRQDHAERARARRGHVREPVRELLRQLLVSGDAGTRRLRHLGIEPAAEESFQRRDELHLHPLPRQRVDQLYGRRVLAGRARRPLSRNDRVVHARQRRVRRPLGQRPADDVGEGHQPRESGRAAARLRRRHQASDRRGAPRPVLS